MDAFQKLIDAISAILGYFKTFAAEIKASLGLGEENA